MSQYPTAVDDASTLFSPVDAFSSKPCSSTLATLCLYTDTTIQLVDGTAGFASSWGIVTIQDEIIVYSSRSGNNLTGCVRGSFGTTPVGHAVNTAVRALMVRGYLTAIQDAVVALQTALGVSGAFNFAPNNLVTTHTMTADWSATSPATPAEGQSLTVIITQNSTGGYVVTWSSDFLGGTQPSPDASSVSIFHFVGHSSKWYQVGQPNIY